MKKVLLFFFFILMALGAIFFPLKETPEIVKASSAPSEIVKVDELVLPEENFDKNEESLVKLQEEFERKEKNLPTLASISNLSDEESHHTPEYLTEGAQIIGEAQEAAEKDPTRREATLEFFLNCTINEDIVPTIRALCWNRTLKESANWGIVLPLSEFEIPEDIQKLAHQLN